MVAHYIVYLLTASGLKETYLSILKRQIPFSKLCNENVLYMVLTYAMASGYLLKSRHLILGEDFLLLLSAYLICQFVKNERKPKITISYGTGIANSFYEGYLKLVIPSDGADYKGLVESMIDWESKEGVEFPVKRLLLVITKSLYCPPDLRDFNEPDRVDLPQLEACVGKRISVTKNVAGVINRRYEIVPYAIIPARVAQSAVAGPPQYVAAVGALQTLYTVLENLARYPELANVDREQLAREFKQQLRTVLRRSEPCRGKCEIVDFDDSPESGQYLPSVLLEKIQDLKRNGSDI